MLHTANVFASFSCRRQVWSKWCKQVASLSNRRGIFMKKKVWPQRRMQVDAYAAGAPHIFSVLSFFYALLLPLSFWGFPEFVYGIHLIFFQSSCIESLSLRCFLPSHPWERPHVRARRSSFSPRRPRKAERACSVFSRGYRAKRVAVVESWKVVWGFKTSTFILVRFRFCFFLSKKDQFVQFNWSSNWSCKKKGVYGFIWYHKHLI